MSGVRLASFLSFCLLIAAPAQAEPVPYEFDMSHSNLSFSYNHLGYSQTDGRFSDWKGVLIIDEEAPQNSSVEVTINTDSLDTFFEKRDAHLKSADFFDTKAFPQASFKSTKVERTAENKLEVSGDLTIRGVTKPAVLDVTINRIAVHPMAKKRAVGFSASTMIKRSDFGIDRNVPFVSDEVDIKIAAEAFSTKN